MSISVKLIFREIWGTTDSATDSACRGTCHPGKAQIVYSGTNNISWVPPLFQASKNRQLVVGQAVCTCHPPLLIEDTVKAPIGDLIADADNDAGTDDVS